MSYTSSHFRIGPESTPAVVRKLLIITCCLSLLSALTTGFFNDQLGISGPEQWLGLSWWGMSRYLWWQPVTFLFVQDVGRDGITLGWFIQLSFNMGILWTLGSEIASRVKKTPFLKFYFITGILSGLFTLFLMRITGTYGTITGATPAIIALVTAWTMIHPENELLLFFLLPIKAKWLTLGLLGIILLGSLSGWGWVTFSLCFFGVMLGYLYALVGWDLHSPFVRMYRFELTVIRATEKCRQYFYRVVGPILRLKPKEGKGTILDIKTGKSPLDDEAFTQAMLRKMAKKGLDSLTWQEKQRMLKISEKRPRQK